MELTVIERLAILNVLPKEGNFLTLRVIRGIVSKVGITSEEIKKFEINTEGEVASWNELGNVPLPFSFDDVELDIIRKQLKKLDSENKLVQEMFSTYEKFCG
jgi:hypothetical protein